METLPPYLRVTYRAVDDSGQPLAWSKDLIALRGQMRTRLRDALVKAAPLAEVTGLRTWTIGAIPQRMEVTHQGTKVTGYPSLVDEGQSVALRMLPSAAEQQSAMWDGTRRLLLLGLGSPLRTLDRGLPNSAKLAIAASARTSASVVYADAASAAVDHLLLEAGGPVWDEAAFHALLADVKRRFAATAIATATTVGEVLATVTRIEARLASMLSAALDATVVDVQAHLDRLLHQRWIDAAGVDRVDDVLRYVRAIEYRVGKAVEQPDRDRSRITSVRALEQDYAAVAARDVDGAVRWMLEEVRVATFAQSVGAKGGASEQKTRKALAAL